MNTTRATITARLSIRCKEDHSQLGSMVQFAPIKIARVAATILSFEDLKLWVIKCDSRDLRRDWLTFRQ